MITIHWFSLFALALSAFVCACLAWYFDHKARRAYALGASDQAAISNRRLEAELEVARERSYTAGWRDCELHLQCAAQLNGHVSSA